ncbi:MAG: ferredoxin family protein [Planctomycetes bacterium]|nr:ferredoxin family protein [Planctomycetota bacterium]
MTWVVTRLCRDNVDTACVAECPVDCFYIPKDTGQHTNQLYISPSECIDCGACEPACPWEAIFKDDSVPAAFGEDVALNAVCDSDRADFETAVENPDTPKPTPEQVTANKAKWGG